MDVKAVGNKLGSVLAWSILGLVWLAALALSPFRIGRLLRTVSLPRMTEYRMRTCLTVLGVALGVGVLVAVVTVNHSIVAGTEATLDDLSGRADLQVAAGASGFAESVLDDVRAVDGVYKLTPVNQQIVNVRTVSGERERLLILGVDLLGGEDAYFRKYSSKELTAIRRDPLEFLNSTHNIIISRQLARRLGTHLHDKLRVSTGSGVQEFDVWGFIEEEGVGRAFGGAVAVMYYPAMQLAFGRGRNIDRIDVAAAAGTEVKRLQASLQARLGPGFSIERPTLRGDRLSKMLVAMRAGLSMASFTALIAGVFLVFNTCAIGVVQRKRELGIFRALGITRGQLVRLLTLEGALLGTAGSLLGVGIGMLVSRAMLRVTSSAVNELYLQQGTNRVQLDLGLVAAAFALGISCSALAARFAAQRASGIRPVEALSATAVPSMLVPASGIGRGDVIGMVLTLAAFGMLAIPAVGNLPVGALAGCVTLTLAAQALLPRAVQLSHRVLSRLRIARLGAPAALAIDNLPRDLGRTAGMASGLMAGVSLTVTVATFIASFVISLNTWSSQVLPGDLFVTSGNSVSGMSSRNIPMDDSLRAELQALPGVAAVRRIRVLETTFRDAAIKLSVTDYGSFLKLSKLTMLEGTQSQLMAAFERGDVAVSENFARSFGVHRGDEVALATATGTHTFKVAAVVVDYMSDVGAVLIDRNTFVKLWADDRVDTYELRLSPGASTQAVRELINQRLSEQHDLFVLTNREFRSVIVKAAEQIFALLHTLEFVTLIVAALGLMTTVLANVMDRVREIGVLRALGMTRRQVISMIVVEAMAVGGIGALAGVVLGSVSGYIVLTNVTAVLVGWYLPYRLPLDSIALLAVVTLLVSLFAGLLPARRAAALVVRDALGLK